MSDFEMTRLREASMDFALRWLREEDEYSDDDLLGTAGRILTFLLEGKDAKDV